jgi:hypothetical protein
MEKKKENVCFFFVFFCFFLFSYLQKMFIQSYEHLCGECVGEIRFMRCYQWCRHVICLLLKAHLHTINQPWKTIITISWVCILIGLESAFRVIENWFLIFLFTLFFFFLLCTLFFIFILFWHFPPMAKCKWFQYWTRKRKEY